MLNGMCHEFNVNALPCSPKGSKSLNKSRIVFVQVAFLLVWGLLMSHAFAAVSVTKVESDGNYSGTGIIAYECEGVCAALGDTLTVTINGFTNLLPEGCDTESNECQVVLFLDGVKLNNVLGYGYMYPEEGATATSTSMKFDLTRYQNADATLDNTQAWAKLLGGLKITQWKTSAILSVSLANGQPITSDQKITLVQLRPVKFWIMVALLALLAYVLCTLGAKTSMLRDGKQNPGDGKNRPFSLAWVQMAWWLYFVVSAFAFIWVVTGGFSLNTTALTLIGIGSGTALGARLIDSNQRQARINELTLVTARQSTLASEISALGTPAPGTPQAAELTAKIIERERLEKQVETFKAASVARRSQGFFNDILSDENGYSFYRLQIVVWTLVLTVIFVHGVWRVLAMPDFEATLLALQGIVSGTYLGFKFQDLPKP